MPVTVSRFVRVMSRGKVVTDELVAVRNGKVGEALDALEAEIGRLHAANVRIPALQARHAELAASRDAAMRQTGNGAVCAALVQVKLDARAAALQATAQANAALAVAGRRTAGLAQVDESLAELRRDMGKVGATSLLAEVLANLQAIDHRRTVLAGATDPAAIATELAKLPILLDLVGGSQDLCDRALASEERQAEQLTRIDKALAGLGQVVGTIADPGCKALLETRLVAFADRRDALEAADTLDDLAKALSAAPRLVDDLAEALDAAVDAATAPALHAGTGGSGYLDAASPDAGTTRLDAGMAPSSYVTAMLDNAPLPATGPGHGEAADLDIGAPVDPRFDVSPPQWMEDRKRSGNPGQDRNKPLSGPEREQAERLQALGKRASDLNARLRRHQAEASRVAGEGNFLLAALLNDYDRLSELLLAQLAPDKQRSVASAIAKERQSIHPLDSLDWLKSGPVLAMCGKGGVDTATLETLIDEWDATVSEQAALLGQKTLWAEASRLKGEVAALIEGADDWEGSMHKLPAMKQPQLLRVAHDLMSALDDARHGLARDVAVGGLDIAMKAGVRSAPSDWDDEAEATIEAKAASDANLAARKAALEADLPHYTARELESEILGNAASFVGDWQASYSDPDAQETARAWAEGYLQRARARLPFADPGEVLPTPDDAGIPTDEELLAQGRAERRAKRDADREYISQQIDSARETDGKAYPELDGMAVADLADIVEAVKGLHVQYVDLAGYRAGKWTEIAAAAKRFVSSLRRLKVDGLPLREELGEKATRGVWEHVARLEAALTVMIIHGPEAPAVNWPDLVPLDERWPLQLEMELLVDQTVALREAAMFANVTPPSDTKLREWNELVGPDGTLSEKARQPLLRSLGGLKRNNIEWERLRIAVEDVVGFGKVSTLNENLPSVALVKKLRFN